jgi:hypothetical protein
MGGGTTNVENPYDDQWIHDWQRAAEATGDVFRGNIDALSTANLDRFNENQSQSTQIGDLFTRSDEATRRLNELGGWNQDRINEISGLRTSLSDLETAFGNRTTSVGDVTGLDSIIQNLQNQYSGSATDISNLQSGISGLQSGIGGLQSGLSNLETSTRQQLDSAIQGLGINNYLKTSDFNTRMSENLGALGETLRGEFGADIAALDLPGVRDSISAARGDLSSLTEQFAGISSDMDWIKQLDLGTFDDRLTAQATDFSGRLSSTEDRFADLLGGQTGNLTNLISESEQRLQQDLGDAATARQGLRSDLATGLQQGATAREGLRSDLATGLQQGTTARERLASELSSGLQQGSEARQALAQQLSDQGYDIDNLSTQLLGYRNDLTDYQNQFRDDLTDLRGVVGTERELALGKLEDEIGQDRTADLLKLRQGIEAGTTSEIERMAGNLRQEYGDQIFDLTDTFGKGQEENRLARQELGADIQDLFGRSLAQDVSVAGLTSNVGTLGQNLDSLKSSFGDFKLDAATNLGNVRRALEGEIGDLSGSLTSGLADLQTDYLDRILGSERAGATARDELRSDLTGALGSETAAREAGLASEAAARQSGLASEAAARQSGLASEASAREAGLASAQSERTRLAEEASRGFQDVYKTREQAISDLSGRFGENLRAQEESLGRRIDDQSRAIDEKIGRLGSMMNYRMLGDSAGGVKMRRSKAYKSGAVNTGTGQLSRTMKLKTLNI